MFARGIVAIGIMLLLFSSSVYSQDPELTWTYKDALHAQMVPFVFNFYGPKGPGPRKTTRIEVINEATLQPIQIFSDVNLPTIERRFSLVDVNFDGIKDICIAKEQKGQHYYFIYDKQAGQFRRNTLLEQIPNATFDYNQKQVVSFENDKDKERSRKTYYEYEGDKLVLARQDIKTCDGNHCETNALVRVKDKDLSELSNSGSLNLNKSNLSPADGLTYLNSLSNQKAACLARVNGKRPSPESNSADVLKAQQQLSECYKKMVIGLASKFYPRSHFGQDLELEINSLVEHHHKVLHRMANCPSSKAQGCRYYEEYDALAGTVDYLNELVEFMVLNIGEGYAEFNPEKWLKKWDAVVRSS
jgi:hypothetical protein